MTLALLLDAEPAIRLHAFDLFVGALVIAGMFTFAPGRIMHAVAFGS